MKKAKQVSTPIIYKVGGVMQIKGQRAVITRVWPLGTVDVQVADGSCFRVTGLPLVSRQTGGAK